MFVGEFFVTQISLRGFRYAAFAARLSLRGFCYAAFATQKPTHFSERASNTPRHPHHRHIEKMNSTSGFRGVSLNKTRGKWRGRVNNSFRLEGMARESATALFDSEAECAVAVDELRKKIHGSFWTTVKSLAAADPLTEGLPLGPKDAYEAEADVVYWRPNKLNAHKPYRVVRSGLKRVKWAKACQLRGCTTQAQMRKVANATVKFCFLHAGWGCAPPTNGRGTWPAAKSSETWPAAKSSEGWDGRGCAPSRSESPTSFYDELFLSCDLSV